MFSPELTDSLVSFLTLKNNGPLLFFSYIYLLAHSISLARSLLPESFPPCEPLCCEPRSTPLLLAFTKDLPFLILIHPSLFMNY